MGQFAQKALPGLASHANVAKPRSEQLIALIGQAGDLQRARPPVEVLPAPERQDFR
jgi:hypothetical protein